MASHRRRHRRFPPLSAASAFAASLFLALLLYASLSLLTPPLDRHSLPGSSHSLPGRSRSRLLNRSTIPRELGSITVPSGGGRSSSRQDLWASKLAKHYYGCSNASSKFEAAEVVTRPNRYLMIATSGGLNQQRTGITDAVVAARILNATLVVPKLDQKSFWKDVSNFAEIFDVDRFIASLSKDVKIIKELPKKGGKHVRSPYTMRVPRKCTPRCYQNRVLPVLLKKHVVQLTKFDYRLANKLETELQKLRCRVNYHALRFTEQIQKMGETLIHRMKGKNKHFIALHLRFESDMLAFSGCYYGGGEKERRELGAIRKRWKTLHIRNPEKERRQGKCPLTPEEVGLMLRALGFGNDVHIYVASGEVYGGEATLAPLRALFPNFHTKETLATKEELAPHSSFSSRMAALDFMVCDGSDVFVTNNNGNMAKMIAGRRRYFGHKRTIRPNAKKLYHVFPNRVNMSWGEFASKVRTYQRGFMGEPKEVRAGRGEFHENPTSCICENVEKKTVGGSGSQSRINTGVDNDGGGDDWLNLDYRDNAPRGLDNSTELDDDDDNDDDDVFMKSDDPELEEIISD